MFTEKIMYEIYFDFSYLFYELRIIIEGHNKKKVYRHKNGSKSSQIQMPTILFMW